MNNIKKVMVGTMCVLLLSGCGAKTIPTLENGEQAVVTLKDNRKIGVSDLYNKLKDQYGLQTVVSMIDKIILEDKYKDSIDAAKDNAQSTIDQLKESYGDDLLSAIQYYTSYNTVEDYQDSVYLSYLENLAIEDYAKGKISEKEIKKYYESDIKPDIKVSHILITADYASDASDEDKNKALEDAKNTANEVISKLNSAENKAETFKELAKEYSKDDSTKEDGGNLGYINKNTLSSSYSEMVKKAYELKDGEYTKEAVKTELGYHIVLRVETKEKASIDEVRDTILEELASKYTTENSDSQIKALQELRKEYELDIVDNDLHEGYTKYIQNSLAQLQQKTKDSTNKQK